LGSQTDATFQRRHWLPVSESLGASRSTGRHTAAARRRRKIILAARDKITSRERDDYNVVAARLGARRETAPFGRKRESWTQLGRNRA